MDALQMRPKVHDLSERESERLREVEANYIQNLNEQAVQYKTQVDAQFEARVQ